MACSRCATLPADVGVVEVLQQDESLRVRSLLELEGEGFVSRLAWIRHQLQGSFCCLGL